ncbi:NAD(P)-dependent oxidoreductase [uncultured Subdoligranulum sp.]|uniref:NAD-dependent epimerase/dehydratase family protein n=1 Tax=uncultured Subdoligranulum sp. TaxID=512298 RepID=UPI0025CBFC3F|nr:NAD(P)-dependent oxidoreductase [uncultured Subdoligranulum sp.]
MILVIGATGYIGRYFCTEMQEQGVDVLALGRSKKVQAFFEEYSVPFQYFDLNDDSCYDALPKNNIEGIIDLSACLAELETPVEDFFRINTLGVYRILEYARQNQIDKVVITSSHKVYNDIYKDVISESDGISFRGDHSPYIISKIAAENFVTYYNKDFGMHAVALRLTGVHGYGEILGHLKADHSYQKSTFEIFFEKALKGQPIEVWGNQSVKRDHVYIKDVVAALLAAVRSPSAKGIYNIASGVGYSQYEEACALAEVFGPKSHKSEVLLCPEKPGLTRGYVYDISRAKQDLHWSPKYIDLITMYTDYRKEWTSKKYHNYHTFLDGQAPETI